MLQNLTEDEVAKIVHDVLIDHTLTHVREQDNESNGLPLIDALRNLGLDAEFAHDELASLEDELMGALMDASKAKELITK